MLKTKPFHSQLQRWLYLLLGTSITIILLAWALKDVSWVTVWNILGQANGVWLFIGWLTYLASYCVRARRWGTLLSATCNPGRYRTRLAGIFIGFGANSVLPVFAGDFLRATIPFRLDGVPFGLAIGSVFAERLLDIGVVFLFLLIPLLLTDLPYQPNLSNLPIGQLGVVIVMLWLAFVIAASFPEKIANLVGLLSHQIGLKRFETRLISITAEFLDGLSALKCLKRSLTALAETIVIWGLNAITFWAGLIAFKLVSLGLLGALFIQSISALSITIPSTPGYVGPFEAGIRFALSFYNVPIDTAVAYAVALRFLMLVITPVIAGIIAVQLGLSKTDLFPTKSALYSTRR